MHWKGRDGAAEYPNRISSRGNDRVFYAQKPCKTSCRRIVKRDGSCCQFPVIKGETQDVPKTTTSKGLLQASAGTKATLRVDGSTDIVTL
jgi:hypothetical protein